MLFAGDDSRCPVTNNLKYFTNLAGCNTEVLPGLKNEDFCLSNGPAPVVDAMSLVDLLDEALPFELNSIEGSAYCPSKPDYCNRTEVKEEKRGRSKSRSRSRSGSKKRGRNLSHSGSKSKSRSGSRGKVTVVLDCGEGVDEIYCWGICARQDQAQLLNQQSEKLQNLLELYESRVSKKVLTPM